MTDDSTPINNQLIKYQLEDLHNQGNKIIDKMDQFLEAFNAHTKDDAVMADRLLRLEEDRKASIGLWSGVVGGAVAAVTAIHHFFKGSP